MKKLIVVVLVALVSSCSSETAGPNRAPVAVAGPDRVAAVDDPVLFNAGGSYDPDGDAITYQWTLVAAPGEAELSAEQTVSTELIPDVDGVWVVRLEVSDGRLKSQPDVVQVRVTLPCTTDQDCDDGEYCNGAESCVDGSCEPGIPPDCGDGDICTQDVCNEDQDRCENPAVTEPPGPEGPAGDATCGDGADNDCDGWTDGEDTGCIVCSSDADCDDHNDCTDDSCEGQDCVHEPVAEGTACDDGLWCTDDGSGGGDVCVGGRCVGQVERDCSGAGDQCNGFACDEEADACVPVPVDDGTGCDDGQWCTTGDECTGGVCAGTERDCSGSGGECQVGVCNEDLDRCEAQDVEDGSPCDDGEYCTVGETCLSGECQGGGPRDCTEVADECNDEACNDQVDACQPIPKSDGTECGTRSCNGLSWMRQTCVAGACTGSELVLDCDDGRDCTTDACDPAAGCDHTPLADGTECGARYCDGLEHRRQTCLSGVCSGSELLADCDDANDCTADSCDGAAGCGNTVLADGTECGSRYCDGLSWMRETCQSGQCTSNALQENCDDSNVCTDDSCDPAGGCTNTNNTLSCDDGDPCTMDDACANGSCAGVPLDADGDTHIAAGCPNGDDCDDGNADVHPGVFEGSYGDPICDDGLDNDCDGLTDIDDRGCQECQTDEDCDDGNACNGVETCQGMVCQPGTPPPPCDDGLYCNGLETCDPVSGGCLAGSPPCLPETECNHCNEDADNCFDPLGTACTDDTLYCTGVETCDGAGSCESSGNPCLPETECNRCNEDADNCFDPVGTACTDDTQYCTGVETCDGAGSCLSSGNPCLPETECNHCHEPTDSCFDPVGTACTDDTVYCNGVEACDGAGSCESSGDPCPQTECNNCNEADGNCFDPEGTFCGSPSDTDCTDPDTCDGSGTCQPNHAPADSPCNDGTYCNGSDTCNAGGVCSNHSGDPCAGGAECNAHCNETAMNCYDPLGTSCGDNADTDCTDPDTCDGAGTCQPNHQSSGFPCDDGLFCTLTDACDGLGECQGTGSPCASGEICLEETDTCVGCVDDYDCPPCQYCNAGDCENQPEGEDYKDECPPGECITGDCDGLGSCGYEAPGTSCGSSAESECDHADQCDGAGFCDLNYEPLGGACGDQGVDCHLDDACDGGGSCVDNGLEIEGTLCGSGNDTECDNPDSCDALGNCLPNYELLDAPCGDQGVDCHVDDACDGAGNCVDNGFEPEGKLCTSDGLYCNGLEQCDDSGGCTAHSGDPCTPPDVCDEVNDVCSSVCTTDADCPMGDICWPSCSPRPDGCLTPPSSLSLSCTDPVNLSFTEVSDCTVTLTGGDNTGQAGCLTCSAEVGVTTVDFTDFSSDGACDLDGWSLVSGNNCSEGTNDLCEFTGAPRNCCSDFFNNICDTATFGQPVARADDRGCGEQVRMHKTFDLTGLDKAWVCFDIADHDADGNESVQLLVDGSNNPGAGAERIFCQDGPPQDQVNDFFYNSCVELPDWAQGQPDVTLTFVMHSENDDDVMFLDNIVLRAWGGGCADDILTVLDEDFNTPTECDTAGWSFTNTDWDCPGFDCSIHAGWSPGVEADGAIFDMDTTVNASELDGEVTLCFLLGYDGTTGTDQLVLEYDAGSGWLQAWRQGGTMGPNGQCREICVNLSDIDPAVNNNSTLGIRFRFESHNGKIDVYGVTVAGARYCPAAPSVVEISSPLLGDGAGNYDFTATDRFGQQLDANITCQWDPDTALNDLFTVHYRDTLAGFTKRRQLTFDNLSRPESLVDFPVLVVLDGAWFDYTQTQDAGQDLRFFDPDGKRLPHEIEEWDEAGTSYVWVKVPQIDAGSDIDFVWMFYGNPAAPDDQAPSEVWTAGYVAVWHLNEAGAVYFDSTANGNDGAQSGNSSAGGIIAGAQYFDGGNDHIEVPSGGLQITGDQITIEAWARPTGEPVNYCHVIGAGSDGHDWQLWWDRNFNGWHGRLTVNGDGGGLYTHDGAYNNWNYLALLYDGSWRRLYHDAVEIGSESGSGNLDAISSALWIGDNPGMTSRDFEGYIDEVRISDVYRTDHWLDAQYSSMRDSLITFGPEEDF